MTGVREPTYLAGSRGTLRDTRDPDGRVGRLLQGKLRGRQVESTLLDMIDCRKSHLQDAQKLMLIVSTHDDGDPFERAYRCTSFCADPRVSRLDHLSYCAGSG